MKVLEHKWVGSQLHLLVTSFPKVVPIFDWNKGDIYTAVVDDSIVYALQAATWRQGCTSIMTSDGDEVTLPGAWPIDTAILNSFHYTLPCGVVQLTADPVAWKRGWTMVTCNVTMSVLRQVGRVRAVTNSGEVLRRWCTTKKPFRLEVVREDTKRKGLEKAISRPRRRIAKKPRVSSD